MSKLRSLQKDALTRRAFLKTSTLAAGAAALGAPALVRGQNLNDRIRVAMIGVGGRGGGNLGSLMGIADEYGIDIAALCDVNENHLNRAAEQFPEASTCVDFRKMFETPDDFDAVVVSVCEHAHAYATMPALELGKHVFCEKPLAYNIWETRKIREAANAAQVATQMGTQIHAGTNYRRVVELVQSGVIGDVKEVHVWVSRAWGWHESEEDAKKAADIVFVQERPAAADPIPEGLNWDLWLGAAPERPFNDVYFPGPKWYRWWDFGNGTMSDLGSHWIDLPFWALKLDRPLTIVAEGPPVNPEIAPASMQVTYEYGQRGELPPVTLTWYQGNRRPPQFTDGTIPNAEEKWRDGVLFVGDKGMVISNYGIHALLPESQFVDFEAPEPFIPDSIGHHAEWIHACKTGAPTTCNFEYAGWLTEANHLGNVAYRAGKKLEWNPVTLSATNAPEAEPYIRRNPRAPWKL